MPAKPPKHAPSGKRPSKGADKPCPICGKPSEEESRPFCSERCRAVDLNRWLSNSYAIPGRKDADEDAD
ncbi:MAG: DNA gyrase inhibitor YacG [Bradyrhizobium sp.]|jgi:endogenous inhibitor of DNA gyrase (YacG/DUF329 family)